MNLQELHGWLTQEKNRRVDTFCWCGPTLLFTSRPSRGLLGNFIRLHVVVINWGRKTKQSSTQYNKDQPECVPRFRGTVTVAPGF
ncbi:hypothetical protein SKAU_G00429490 [Synaphobranchus kaupii]|uniref:Uncharacterized protein n=1 Tax=Synaphobranchus kaupii TaxID=118154 RepID=A0A9Q1E4F2_SYNKA|nr:hypothetical protein SKAU_G00429490 [Synaphobranchus kaupii]